EPLREPADRLCGRTRLAAFDLAHVLLREAAAGELALRQSGCDPELAEALAEPLGLRQLGVRGGAGQLVPGRVHRRRRGVAIDLTQPHRFLLRVPQKGAFQAVWAVNRE